MKKILMIFFLLSIGSGVSSAAQLMYLYSTDFKKDSEDPMKFHYSNAFDNDEKTLWCFEHSPGGREEIILYFAKTVEIKKVTIKNGINPKVNKDILAGGAKEVEIAGEFSKNTLYLDEGLLSKTLSLSPPITTNRLLITITDVYNKESDHICIRDIQFSGIPDNLIQSGINRIFKQKVDDSQYWGRWQGGTSEGDYEKFLFLGLEGNYIFIYAPFDPDLKGLRGSGTYRLKENEIIINYKNEQIKGRFEKNESAKPILIFDDDRFKGKYYFEP